MIACTTIYETIGSGLSKSLPEYITVIYIITKLVSQMRASQVRTPQSSNGLHD